MPATILDGKSIADQIQQEIKQEVAAFTAKSNVVPCLAAVLVGDDPASDVYVRSKRKACERLGMTSQLIRLPATTTQSELIALVQKLNADASVHGILVQLPLPKGINSEAVLDTVTPLKDVDCFHAENVGLMAQGRPRYLPCTPHGVLQILSRCDIPTAGKHVVVIGRSEIVGKPMALMLVQKDSTRGPSAANATVTICHSQTANLPEITRLADILVVAIGKPKFVSASMVKPGAVVVDVGIHRTDDGLCGDVAFDEVREVASAITPVPGGVGPLTVTMLMENTLRAARELSK